LRRRTDGRAAATATWCGATAVCRVTSGCSEEEGQVDQDQEHPADDGAAVEDPGLVLVAGDLRLGERSASHEAAEHSRTAGDVHAGDQPDDDRPDHAEVVVGAEGDRASVEDTGDEAEGYDDPVPPERRPDAIAFHEVLGAFELAVGRAVAVVVLRVLGCVRGELGEPGVVGVDAVRAIGKQLPVFGFQFSLCQAGGGVALLLRVVPRRRRVVGSSDLQLAAVRGQEVLDGVVVVGVVADDQELSVAGNGVQRQFRTDGQVPLRGVHRGDRGQTDGVVAPELHARNPLGDLGEVVLVFDTVVVDRQDDALDVVGAAEVQRRNPDGLRLGLFGGCGHDGLLGVREGIGADVERLSVGAGDGVVQCRFDEVEVVRIAADEDLRFRPRSVLRLVAEAEVLHGSQHHCGVDGAVNHRSGFVLVHDVFLSASAE